MVSIMEELMSDSCGCVPFPRGRELLTAAALCLAMSKFLESSWKVYQIIRGLGAKSLEVDDDIEGECKCTELDVVLKCKQASTCRAMTSSGTIRYAIKWRGKWSC